MTSRFLHHHHHAVTLFCLLSVFRLTDVGMLRVSQIGVRRQHSSACLYFGPGYKGLWLWGLWSSLCRSIGNGLWAVPDPSELLGLSLKISAAKQQQARQCYIRRRVGRKRNSERPFPVQLQPNHVFGPQHRSELGRRTRGRTRQHVFLQIVLCRGPNYHHCCDGGRGCWRRRLCSPQTKAKNGSSLLHKWIWKCQKGIVFWHVTRWYVKNVM